MKKVGNNISEKVGRGLSLLDSAWRGRLRVGVIDFFSFLIQKSIYQLIMIFLTALRCVSYTFLLRVLSRTHARRHFCKMEFTRVVDMLKIMTEKDGAGNPIPFSITFVTCDMRQNTGGKKITLKSAILPGYSTKINSKKNPNHYSNYTRNILAEGGDRPIKIHALLVTEFNGTGIIL